MKIAAREHRSTSVRNDATSTDLNKDHACTRRRLRKMWSTKDVLATLCVLLLLYDHTSSLIIPEELPTILSLIYSNIPPIKKGTDSRVGVGFRLGEHADFQILLELGPQTETEPIGNADSKRRRNAMFNAAMRGELGSLAQAVAKYQTQRKLQRELEKLKKTEEKQGEATAVSQGKKTEASEWLSKWSKGMVKSSEDEASIEDISNEKSPSSFAKKNTVQRIGRPPLSNGGTGSISDLKTLYKEQTDQKN
ncbi:snustorr snarlik isoform X2 [Lasioglossum baleicum]|uniref:snustorr snarlik isoform X2 n=1 Tax=Lasioglossum baleicum TaxID=434251 RepID=UPI003FCE9EC3